jgi:hypothetical protein
MISVVNGYVCLTSCDAAAAKYGKDPAAPPGSFPGTSDKNASSFDAQPATVLDGALKDLARTHTATATSGSRPADARQKVNLLA